MNEEKDTLESECEIQLNMLSEQYSTYANRQPQKKGLKDMFSKWVRNDAGQIDPADKEFLKNVEGLIEKLDKSLSKIAGVDRSHSEKLCGRALSIIFAPKSAKETNDTERYLTASEYLAPVLFEHASRDDLHRIRKELLDRIPKRLMFPKQRELVDVLDQMLSK